MRRKDAVYYADRIMEELVGSNAGPLPGVDTVAVLARDAVASWQVEVRKNFRDGRHSEWKVAHVLSSVAECRAVLSVVSSIVRRVE